eukprot:COSAG04_NODE_16109_length_509_cov_1.456098_2_plen_61_part_01
MAVEAGLSLSRQELGLPDGQTYAGSNDPLTRDCLCHSGPPPLPLWLLTAWPGGAAWCHAAL